MEALDNRPLSVRLKGLQEKISRKRHSKLLARLRIMSPARLLLPHVICEKKIILWLCTLELVMGMKLFMEMQS
ncbi:hypothetical protein QL285_091636 [Trifolium repens]|nr:hypothetical protein QL285_091636 [Trifolium repens]